MINSFLKTGCPILVNTSFNIRGEPIVCSPRDVFNCFMGTDLDILVIENFLLFKKDQDNKLLKGISLNMNWTRISHKNSQNL